MLIAFIVTLSAIAYVVIAGIVYSFRPERARKESKDDVVWNDGDDWKLGSMFWPIAALMIGFVSVVVWVGGAGERIGNRMRKKTPPIQKPPSIPKAIVRSESADMDRL